ncbi:MAG: hypothetical protein H3C31_11320 [Brumimicrobium sp.]|nr:hypothetical protein [Brumimicrobium sp.]
MKQLLFFILIILAIHAHAQNRNLSLSIFQSISHELGLISHLGSQIYSETNISIGFDTPTSRGSINVSGIYCFTGSLSGRSEKYYLLKSHSTGASIKYIFRESDKTTRPFIKIGVLTELGSNFRDRYLLQDEYIPKLNPSTVHSYPVTPPDWKPKLLYYYSDLYYSTPLVSNLTAGIDIRLMQNFNLNIGVGYGFRIMKVKSAKWKAGEDYREKAKNIPTKSVYSHMLDFELGVSYAIPMKSGGKSKE